jgi:hypothetical protein
VQPAEFLSQVQSTLSSQGGHRPSEAPEDWEYIDRTPRLYTWFRGHRVKLGFPSEHELLLQLMEPPPHLLLLRRERFLWRLLDTVGLLPEVRIGVPDFDERFIIQNATARVARRMLGAEARQRVLSLEPFEYLELTTGDYRVLKAVRPGVDYSVEQAIRDLDNLVGLHRAMQGPG